MADNTNLPEIHKKLDMLEVGGCTCQCKSFDIQYHAERCHYRLASEIRALLADRESRVPSDDAIIELAHKHGLNRCEERERAALIPFARALLSRPSGEVVGTGASELLGYAPKHDDLLKGIRDNLNIMLASARTHSDGDFVSGYTIKTGALHRIIGLLQIAGFPVIVPAAPAAPASPEAKPVILLSEDGYMPVRNDVVDDKFVYAEDAPEWLTSLVSGWEWTPVTRQVLLRDEPENEEGTPS